MLGVAEKATGSPLPCWRIPARPMSVSSGAVSYDGRRRSSSSGKHDEKPDISMAEDRVESKSGRSLAYQGRWSVEPVGAASEWSIAIADSSVLPLPSRPTIATVMIT